MSEEDDMIYEGSPVYWVGKKGPELVTPEEEAKHVEEEVNKHPNAATDPDEDAILKELYGDADKDGVYRGDENG